MCGNNKINEDYIFSDEKLYFRKKITFFELIDVDALSLYIKKDGGFFTSELFDYLEVSNSDDYNKIKYVLSKEIITNDDLLTLIFIFGNIAPNLTLNQYEKIVNDKFGKLDINQIYFSVGA